MRTHRWIGAAAVATAFTLGAAQPGHAADPPPISAADDAKAIKFLAEGNKAFKAGKFADAEKAYEQAFALKRVHDIAINLGMAEFAQGNKMRDAAEHLGFGLRLLPITVDPAQREQIQKTFDQCKRAVGSVKVNVNVKGALVYVEGNPVGEAPLFDDVFVEPGEYTFEAKADGYKPMSQRVKADKGSTVEVTFNLAALPKEKQRVIVQVQAPRRNLVPVFVAGGAAVVAAVVGGSLYGVAEGKRASALNSMLAQGSCLNAGRETQPCQDLEGKAYAVDTLHNVAIGAFVGAGVAAAGALAYLLWPNPKAKKPTTTGLHAVPLLGPGLGGVMASGAF